MGRNVTSDLQDLFDLPSCESQTTLDLTLADTTQIHIATKALTVGAVNYTADLRKTNELNQTVIAAPNRVVASIQNVDKVFGGRVVDEDLIKAKAVLGREYSDPSGILPSVWKPLFNGEAFPLSVNEQTVEIEVLHPLVAAGYCVGQDTLAENCQFQFKHAGTCGYSGIETTCNKKRKSKLGCLGRANEHRFGGMEYPDIQATAAPTGSGGTGGGGHHHCPYIYEYVLVRTHWTSQPRPKQIYLLDPTDELFDPIAGVYRKIKELETILDVPLWQIATANGGRGSSSHTHPVIPYVEHITGERISRTFAGDPILTWSNLSLVGSTIGDTADAKTKGSVMRIELEEGHIYCWSATSEGPYIVCHNAKPIEIIE